MRELTHNKTNINYIHTQKSYAPPIKISNFLLYESPRYIILIWMVLQRFVNKMILFPLTIIMSLEPNRMHVKLQNHNFRKIQYLHVLLFGYK